MESDKANMFFKSMVIMRADVGREMNSAATNWHYHLAEDNFKHHYEEVVLKHNTLPAWGSPKK